MGALTPLEGRSPSNRPELVVYAGIAVVHTIACVLARALGFDHVSDDDFARVTIAQTFAHAPTLDPSHTSWLPFPFWILGGLMLLVGRSLLAAQALSITLASLAATTPYLALRYVGVPQNRALLGWTFAFGTPWALWLGAATVPESFTASLTAAGVIGLGGTSELTLARVQRAWPFALAITAACLSRYETWPAAAVLAIALARLLVARHDARPWRGIAIALCVAGPLAWMAWNAHAHDGPLHFFRRVSSFKRAIGDGSTSTLGSLLLYPRLLVSTRPEVTLAAIALLPGLRARETRQRWLVPLLCVAAQIAFLAYGQVRDGAPAHHPERALLGPLMLLGLFVVDAGAAKVRALIDTGRASVVRIALAAFLAIWATWIARSAEIPGRTALEDRSAQLAAGEKLRAESAREIVVTPCAFEHFALLAAFGAPEAAEVKPRTNEPLTNVCPHMDSK